MCFNFQIAFWKECKGVTVFQERTSFLNTSYLFQSHYCNARFAYIRNPKNIQGTGALGWPSCLAALGREFSNRETLLLHDPVKGI